MNKKDLHKPAENESGSGVTTPNRYKRKRRALTEVNQVLAGLVSSMGLERRLKEHTLLNLWPVLVGDMFAQKSRPLFMDHEGNIVIAVKDASTGQELTMHKTEILKKLGIAAGSMGLTVRGLRFDLKHFHRSEEQLCEEVEELTFPVPTAEQLDQTVLNESELIELEQLRIRLSDGGNTVKDLNERILTISMRELKLRAWRRSNSFPACVLCASPAPKLLGPNKLCANCYFKEVTPQEF